MKKTRYLSLCAMTALVLSAAGSKAQTITTHMPITYPDSMCIGAYIDVKTSSYAPSLSITTFYGDGTSTTDPVLNGGSYGYVYLTHNYASAGTYTLKHVLYNGSSAIDSATESYFYQFCNTFTVCAYNDADNDCVFDTTTENYAAMTMTVEVDSAGTPIDTITSISGFHYSVYGIPGTVYDFKVLSTAGGVAVTCPMSGILSYTVQPTVNAYVAKFFGVQCTAATGLDVFGYTSVYPGRHHLSTGITVGNNFCNPQNVTVTMHGSPKYDFQFAFPTPSSVSGNTVVWNLTGVSSINPVFISTGWEVPGAWLLGGDTVHTDYEVAPVTGDSDPSNNTIVRVDTVSGAYDPNEKEVSPKGNITAGTKLTYTIHFENTGNDTAFNIHVMDTLSDNVDPRSLKIISASARMNVTVYKEGVYNVAKFDFPNINLLDTTHHGQNTGMFVYSINSKTGLANGTLIKNRAGIYFDFNDPILTNTVTNMIGIPTSTQVMSNVSRVEIYPNPVSDVLTLKMEKDVYNTVTITNIVGQVMLRQQISNAREQVNVKAFPAGTYFVTLIGEGGVKTLQFQKL